MKQKNRIFFLLISALFIIFQIGCDQEKQPQAEKTQDKSASIEKTFQKQKQVILTLGSWRKDDVEQIDLLLKKFSERYPHIVIKFDPTSPAEYNDVIAAQLEGGTAPDLFYLRSFSHSEKMYRKGYLKKLSDLPGLKDAFPPHMLSAWSSDQEIYGVPLMAVSHGIYYNASLFNKMKIEIPKSWEELLDVAKIFKKQGINAFANASGEDWTISGLILHTVIPGIIGGEKGRLEYYNGDRCFNDHQIKQSYKAVQDVSHYVSKNHRQLKYADSLQLFIQGKSPMMFGGSWDISFFEKQNIDFDWSVFPVPSPKGKPHIITFQPDAGIGLNKDSKHAKEALIFLQWLTTVESSSLFANLLPGFFPLHKQVPNIKNKHANTFLDFNRIYQTDLRFSWGKIRDGVPSSYTLTLDTARDVMNGLISYEEGAERLQQGLEKWYTPAMNCKK